MQLCSSCKELRSKRVALGLSADARAIIICDDALQHHSEEYKEMRLKFESDKNCCIIGSIRAPTDGRPVMKGGYGAWGAPNDGGIHQHFHRVRKAYQKLSCNLMDVHNAIHEIRNAWRDPTVGSGSMSSVHLCFMLETVSNS